MNNELLSELEIKRRDNEGVLVYNYINFDDNNYYHQSLEKWLIKIDVLLTKNWCMISNTLYSSYDISIPIYKGDEISIGDMEYDSFCIDIHTNNLLYKDSIGSIWIIASVLEHKSGCIDEILRITIIDFNLTSINLSDRCIQIGLY